jgi:glutamate carboxypeptidase
MQRLALIVLCALISPARPIGQTLSPVEQQIAAAADSHVKDAQAFLERTVNIDSATENLAGVRRVGDLFRAELEALGFTSRWIDLPPQLKRAGHLLAERRGTEGRRLLILGHLDTVLQGERFRSEAGRMFGTGVNDMKGGDVVLLYALKALHSVGALENRRVAVLLTGDEESPGDPLSVSRRDLVDLAKRSDVALSFETTVRNTATIARRGSSRWTLEVKGETGHSSGVFGPEVGSGAIFEAARILNAFHEQVRGPQYLTFNASLVVGGTDVEYAEERGVAAGKTNVVPQKVVVRGDLRFISEEQKESAREKMRRIVSESLPRTSATIVFQDLYPAMPPRDENLALLRQLDQISRDLGGEAVEALDPGERGAGDISFAAPFTPGLDGLGVKGDGAHAPGEWADLASMPLLIKRAAILMYRLTR